MTRPRSFPYHGLTDVEVGMSCPGTRGGMGSMPRSAATPNRAWYCLHKQSTRKLHRTWDGSTEVSPRPEYRRLYGRVRCGPLRWMRDPTLKRTLTLYPGPHAAARLDPPLYPRESVSKGKGKGRCSQGVSRSVGGWAGKDRKTA